MNKGDYIKYAVNNPNWTLTKDDSFQLLDIVEYDEMTVMCNIENISNGKQWGINYFDLNKYFITFDVKDERNIKINNILNDN